MTNAEKYFEVFGIIPDKNCCPTEACAFCPGNTGEPLCGCKWWDSEWKEKEKKNENSCEFCKYQNKRADEEPCNKCKHSHEDRFEWEDKKSG